MSKFLRYIRWLMSEKPVFTAGPPQETWVRCMYCGKTNKDRPRNEAGHPTDIWITEVECRPCYVMREVVY